MTGDRSWKPVGVTLLTEVALPLAIYGSARSLDVSAVWSLVSAGAVSVVTGAAQWVRRRRVGLLGVIVLSGFVGSAAAAVLTSNPVAVFMVDPANNVAVAIAVLVMMGSRRPFVAWIRRDLSPRPHEFDRRWETDPAFRAVHRTASWIWAGGLVLVAASWTAAVTRLPFDAAVAASRVVGLTGFLAMIGGSEWVVRHGGRRE